MGHLIVRLWRLQLVVGPAGAEIKKVAQPSSRASVGVGRAERLSRLSAKGETTIEGPIPATLDVVAGKRRHRPTLELYIQNRCRLAAVLRGIATGQKIEALNSSRS